MRLATVVFVASGVLALVPSANASTLTWQVTGTITEFNDPSHLLGIDAIVGDPYTATYSFDTSAVGGCPSPQWCIYGGLSAFIVSTGGEAVQIPVTSAGGASTSIEANALHDTSYAMTYAADVFAAPYTPGFNGITRGAEVVLSSVSSAPLSGPLLSAALPSSPLDPGAFTSASFSYGASEYDGTSANPVAMGLISGTVDAINPVPLPATDWLVLGGLGALCAFARRRHGGELEVPEHG